MVAGVYSQGILEIASTQRSDLLLIERLYKDEWMTVIWTNEKIKNE